MSCSRKSILNITYDKPGYALISRCCHLKEENIFIKDIFSNDLDTLAKKSPLEKQHFYQCKDICDLSSHIEDVVLSGIAKCNLHCYHCCAGFDPNIGEWPPMEISLQELNDRKNFFFNVLSYLRTCDLNSITFDGTGEIFLYYDDLIRELSLFSGDKTKVIYFMTNATLLNTNKIINLLKISKETGVQYRFCISIDGITEETYNACRPNADFNKVLSNLKLIQKLFPNSDVLFTVLRPNIKDVPYVEDFFKKYKVNLIWGSDYFDEEYCSKFVPVEKRYS